MLAAFSFLAGVVTILSPCILPVLPVILTGAVGRGQAKPWGVMTGFVMSFTCFTLFIAFIIKWTGLPADTLRLCAIVLLGLFGLFLCIPALQAAFENGIAAFLPRQGASNKGKGFWSGALVGMSLGLIWTPCVGPIMAAVITLAATRAVSTSAVVITLAYALGAALPMLAIMRGGRKLLDRNPWIRVHALDIQRCFGVFMILAAVMLFQGYDRALQTFILERFPAYGRGLTLLENDDRVTTALKRFTAETKHDAAAVSAGVPAPEIMAGGSWFNTLPLSLKGLRGKVVVIDFWTYTCINCIRTLPELKAWHERYADQGLVIIGVHTPEFEFEKSPGNVARAVTDFGLKYPVVQDNNYATWNAYGNRYWPAKYFIDSNGYIRGVHFGEGGEKESEAMIRRLLKEAGGYPGAYAQPHTYAIEAGTPETYLGMDRSERFGSLEMPRAGTARYSLPAVLKLNNYAYAGEWLLAGDHASAGLEARLDFHFLAKDVFLVMRAEGREPGLVQVFMDGMPVGAAEAGRDVHDGYVQVQDDRLYHVLSLQRAAEHTLTLKFLRGTMALFAFTFG